MKIAIPVETSEGMNSIVAAHFGHAPFYAFFDDATNQLTVVPNGSSHNGGEKLPPEWLHDEGIDVLVCNGLGARAIGLCEQLGVRVFISEEQTIAGAIGAFRAGSLSPAGSDDACAHEH